jgi:hypothetical protein
MFGKRSELQIPHVAVADSKSFEILRVWISGGAQHVSMKTGVWNDPAAWGLMLADLARHAANAYASEGKDKDASLKRICEGFRLEMDSPTDDPTGGIPR